VGGTPEVTINEVRLHATSLRVKGDGDLQYTTRMNADLRWRANEPVESYAFDMAPTVRYSSVEVQIQRGAGGSGQAAIEIKGKVQRTDGLKNFDIDSDDSIIPVEVNITLMLSPGTQAKVVVEVDFVKMLEGVPWESISLSDGDIVIDDDDMSEMALVRQNVKAAFPSTAAVLQ
jgi:hypothetical protein